MVAVEPRVHFAQVSPQMVVVELTSQRKVEARLTYLWCRDVLVAWVGMSLLEGTTLLVELEEEALAGFLAHGRL